MEIGTAIVLAALIVIAPALLGIAIIVGFTIAAWWDDKSKTRSKK